MCNFRITQVSLSFKLLFIFQNPQNMDITIDSKKENSANNPPIIPSFVIKSNCLNFISITYSNLIDSKMV